MAGPTAGQAVGKRSTFPRVLLIVGIAVVVVIIAVVVAIQIYAAAQTGDDVAEPGVGSDSAPAVSRDLAELDGDWSVGDGSEAGYRVDEVLSGQDVTVVGRTTQVTGTATVADGDLTSATVEVDMASIKTDEAARDNQFQGILNTSEFPTATFTTDEPVDISAVADGETVTVDVPGTMVIMGASNEVMAEIEVRLTDAGADLAASIPVSFAEYGVEAPDLGFVKVEDTGTVEAELHLTR